MPAQTVLDICQVLYERHKLITYPRSDNRYLPKDHHRDAPAILKAVAANGGQTTALINGADAKKQSKCFNDAKVAALLLHLQVTDLHGQDPLHVLICWLA